MLMHNASISFESFLIFMQKKAKCATSNHFQKRKYFYNFLFQKKREGKNTQQFSFRKEKNFATILKCTNSKQKQK